MPKRFDSLQNFAHFYGFEIQNVKNLPQYQNRKGDIWGLYDRRNGNLIATSSTLYGLEGYLSKRVTT